MDGKRKKKYNDYGNYAGIYVRWSRLMADAALKEEEFTIPAGGIADFYMEDDEIAALEREEAEQAFGKSGIAEFGEVASRMASYGRGGDDTIAHVATGEIIIPLPLIENNPRMKASIFNHLRELGVEEPEQYVVGSSANSINPETGLAEFGWLKKTFKKITKAVKKVAKKVVKVVKKIAPVVIPFALNAMFPGLGAIFSGALGSGIGTLVQGGSLKDAFKNALIGGAIGGVTAGVSGGIKAAQAGTSISEGAMSGIKNAAKLSNLSTAGKQLVSGQFGQSGLDAVNVSSDTFAANYPDYGTAPTSTTDVVSQAIDFGAGQGPYDPSAATSNYNFMPDVPAAGGTPSLYPDVSGSFPPVETNFYDTLQGYADTATEYGGKTMDFLTGGTPDPAAIDSYAANLIEQNPSVYPGAAGAKVAREAAVQALSPGLLRTYGPSAALAGAGAYAAGFFDTPEEDPVDTPPTGEELIAADPEKYRVADLESRYSTGPTEVASPYTIIPGQGTFTNPFYRPQYAVQSAAQGGEIFPRRTGGIMPDEGIRGQDSVRAMLMPGEFVMTTDAVRGLGNGSEKQGINNMYQMMRGLEARGRGMA
jgi:hypothetical protein